MLNDEGRQITKEGTRFDRKNLTLGYSLPIHHLSFIIHNSPGLFPPSAPRCTVMALTANGSNHEMPLLSCR